MPLDLASLSTLTGSNYPCLELIFMVPKVFEPLKFDCISVHRHKFCIFFQKGDSICDFLFAKVTVIFFKTIFYIYEIFMFSINISQKFTFVTFTFFRKKAFASWSYS